MHRLAGILLFLVVAPAGAQDAAGRARALAGRLAAAGTETDARAAALDLSRLGEAARRPLLDLLPQLSPREAGYAWWVLIELPDAQVRDALLPLARDRRVEMRRIAAEFLGRFEGDAACADALLMLTSSSDARTRELAMGGLMRGAFPTAWTPLLARLRADLEAGREDDVYPLTRALERTLQRHPEDAPAFADSLLAAAGEVEDAGGRLQLFTLAANSQAPAVLPYLLAVLDDFLPAPPAPIAAAEDDEDEAAQPEAEQEDPRVVAALEPGGVLDGLRPFTPEMAAVAAEKLGRAAYQPAFRTLLRATCSQHAAVRRAAMRFVWGTAADEEQRFEAVRALINILGCTNRELRLEAYRLLTRLTRQELPLSLPRWLAWAKAEEARRATHRELLQTAQASGYATVEEYLKFNPDEAPDAEAEEEAPGGDDAAE